MLPPLLGFRGRKAGHVPTFWLLPQFSARLRAFPPCWRSDQGLAHHASQKCLLQEHGTDNFRGPCVSATCRHRGQSFIYPYLPIYLPTCLHTYVPIYPSISQCTLCFLGRGLGVFGCFTPGGLMSSGSRPPR